MVSLVGVHETIVIATHDGLVSGDVRPLIRMNISVIIEQMVAAKQEGMVAEHALITAISLEQDRAMGYAREALRQADVAMQAEPAPAGNMTVVLGPGWPGILLHEAIGHGLEGDFNRKGTSAFSRSPGRKSGITTVYDRR